jgi:hypothetical protein
MEKQPLKHQLPFPYNQDLSKVLRHLDRRTPFGRARLANDPVTAAYIAAAMRLARKHLGPGAERRLADAEDDTSIARPLLAFLSQRAVAAEVTNNPHPFPKFGNVSTFRSTWESQSDFIADLLSFGLWSAQYPGVRKDDTRDSDAENVITGDDPVQAIHNLAYWETSTLINSSSFRLRLIAAASAEGDEIISEAMDESYRGGLEPWKEIYEKFIQARGLRLREGISIYDFAKLLSACSAGVALHVLGKPDPDVVDHNNRRSLLGTGGLAIIYGCLERVDEPTSLTLEQSVALLLANRPAPGVGFPPNPDVQVTRPDYPVTEL